MRKTVLIITLISSVLSACNKSQTEENNKIAVKTIKAVSSQISPKIESYGTLTYKTKNEVTSLVSGTICKKYAQSGQAVKKGQVLYELENIDLLIQKAQYENDISSSKSALNYSKAAYSDARLAVQSRLLNLQNMNLKLSQMQQEYLLKEQEFNKQKEIYKIGGISQQLFLQMEVSVNELSNNIDILKKEISINELGLTKKDLISNGIEPSEDNDIFTDQIIDLNCKSQLAQIEVKTSEYNNSLKNLELINNLIEKLTVKSPVDGVIVQTNYEIGEYVTQNQIMLTIFDITELSAVFSIHETQINNIFIGQEITIESQVLKEPVFSTVNEISNYADTLSGNFNVKSIISNNKNVLKPGMFVKGSIECPNQNKLIRLPKNCIKNNGGTTAYFFIVSKNIAIRKELNSVYEDDFNFYTNDDSLNNYLIIENPSDNIKEGSNVTIL